MFGVDHWEARVFRRHDTSLEVCFLEHIFHQEGTLLHALVLSGHAGLGAEALEVFQILRQVVFYVLPEISVHGGSLLRADYSRWTLRFLVDSGMAVGRYCYCKAKGGDSGYYILVDA